jgi:hypothetical protein
MYNWIRLQPRWQLIFGTQRMMVDTLSQDGYPKNTSDTSCSLTLLLHLATIGSQMRLEGSLGKTGNRKASTPRVPERAYGAHPYPHRRHTIQRGRHNELRQSLHSPPANFSLSLLMISFTLVGVSRNGRAFLFKSFNRKSIPT